jgi:hypothetical protein
MATLQAEEAAIWPHVANAYPAAFHPPPASSNAGAGWLADSADQRAVIGDLARTAMPKRSGRCWGWALGQA